jgi:hypothetical protein
VHAKSFTAHIEAIVIVFFQSNDANLVSAIIKIAQAKASLLAMKDFPGKSLKNMWDMCDSTGSFKSILLKSGPILTLQILPASEVNSTSVC